MSKFHCSRQWAQTASFWEVVAKNMAAITLVKQLTIVHNAVAKAKGIYTIIWQWCMEIILLFCSIWLSILILVLVHGCKIASELKKTAPTFHKFPGGHAPRPPSLSGPVDSLTSLQPAATALPWIVENAVLLWSPLATSTCQYPLTKSKVLSHCDPANMSSIMSILCER